MTTKATSRQIEHAQDNVRRVWNRDIAALEAVLAPHVFEDDDGALLLRPDAPAEAADLYRRMVSIGYAKGFYA